MSKHHKHYRDRGSDGRLLAKNRRPNYRVRFPRGTPKWWRNLYMTRPRRYENKRLCHSIRQGADPDALVFPLGNHKPHVYYW